MARLEEVFSPAIVAAKRSVHGGRMPRGDGELPWVRQLTASGTNVLQELAGEDEQPAPEHHGFSPPFSLGSTRQPQTLSLSLAIPMADGEYGYWTHISRRMNSPGSYRDCPVQSFSGGIAALVRSARISHGRCSLPPCAEWWKMALHRGLHWQ